MIKLIFGFFTRGIQIARSPNYKSTNRNTAGRREQEKPSGNLFYDLANKAAPV